MQVVVQESFEDALKELKKKVNRDGIHKQVKARLSFIKPGEKRREKQRLNGRRLREQAKKRERERA